MMNESMKGGGYLYVAAVGYMEYMDDAAVVEVILDHCGKTLIHESCGT